MTILIMFDHVRLLTFFSVSAKRFKRNKNSCLQYRRRRYNSKKHEKLSEREKKSFCMDSHRILTSRRHRRTSRLDSVHNASTFYKSSRKILFLVGASRCILIRIMLNKRKWYIFFFIFLFLLFLVRFSNRKYIYISQHSY